MTTPTEAKDEMCAVFRDVWPHNSNRVRWPDITGGVPDGEEPWARVTIRTADGRQATLSGANGSAKYDESGTLWIELFTPAGAGQTVGLELAHAVLQAYRAARGGVWYRRPRHRDPANDGAFAKTICLIDFTYST